MPEPLKNSLTVRCSCGRVQLEAAGAPIISLACHCDDCQAGSLAVEALPGAAPVRDAAGGTPYVLYRKDRVTCIEGATLLKSYKLKDISATNRIVATCCNAAMTMGFDDSRHWVSMYRARFETDVPPLEMRICTKFKAGDSVIPDDLPAYPGFPLKFMAKLVAAWIPMLLRR
ncbi:GFA family protein [Phreatobacter stygius]|uniref:CENP-V/GFA domain-containing protein n=1 Tax=Phreatobacter stygius TaxID=1940610 RepID=A0A4D7B4L7_9HYPH|nr:hypothetical protein [Phreatobacter stygius]QCI65963.1 hypothetical protein E8M01_18155 [Phreatobacter stygius]